MAIQPPEPDRSTLTALTSYQGTYHNHKEQLGYAAAVLYAGGAAALVFGPDPWRSYPPWAKGLFLILLAMTGVAGLFYVFWQFRLRAIAAVRIDRLLRMLPPELQWLTQRGEGEWFQRWAAPGTALLVMLLWGAAAFVRVVCGLGS
jgi:hypothetical protein